MDLRDFLFNSIGCSILDTVSIKQQPTSLRQYLVAVFYSTASDRMVFESRTYQVMLNIVTQFVPSAKPYMDEFGHYIRALFWWILQVVVADGNVQNRSPRPQACHQHNLSSATHINKAFSCFKHQIFWIENCNLETTKNI